MFRLHFVASQVSDVMMSIEPSPLGERDPMISPLSVCQYVRMSVCKLVNGFSPKWHVRIF